MTTPPDRLRVPPRSPRTGGPVAVLVALSAASAAVIYHYARDLTFQADEWAFILRRREFTVDTFLLPHNEHLLAAPVGIYQFLMRVAGIGDYAPYVLSALAVHMLCGGLIWEYARRRIGAWPAIVPAAALLFLGSAWQVLLWPFEISFTGSLAAGIAAFLMLDRGDRRGDLFAVLLVIVALAFSGLGVGVMIAVGCEMASRPGSRRRVLMMAAPLALYGAWYLAYRPATGAPIADNAFGAPRYVADMVASGLGGVTGLGLEWGRVLALGAAVAVVWRAVVAGRAVDSHRVAAIAVWGFTFWLSTAALRAHLGGAGESRYVYPTAVVLLLAAVEFVPRSAADAFTGRRVVPVCAAVLAVAVIGNLGDLRNGSRQVAGESQRLQVALATLELIGDRAGLGFAPDPARAPDLVAGAYLPVVRQMGSPVSSAVALGRLHEPLRTAADDVLRRALPLSVVHRPPRGVIGSAPRIGDHAGGRLSGRTGCVVFRPDAPGAVVDLELPAQGVRVHAAPGPAVAVWVRSYATTFEGEPAAQVVGASTTWLSAAPMAPAPAWHLRLRAEQRVDICGIAPTSGTRDPARAAAH